MGSLSLEGLRKYDTLLKDYIEDKVSEVMGSSTNENANIENIETNNIGGTEYNGR